jgi:hypothetical protein
MYRASLPFPSSPQRQQPPHSVIPRILKHTTPGVVFIGICEFIFRKEKIAEFSLSFIRGSTRLRERTNVQRNISSCYKSDWSLRAHSSYYSALHSVIYLSMSVMGVMAETGNEASQPIWKKLMITRVIYSKLKQSKPQS